MAFSETTKDQAFARAGGRCECRRDHASHRGYRCATTFTRNGGQWDAHHITAVSADGSDGLSNCEALCLACHKQTGSYGR